MLHVLPYYAKCCIRSVCTLCLYEVICGSNRNSSKIVLRCALKYVMTELMPARSGAGDADDLALAIIAKGNKVSIDG